MTKKTTKQKIKLNNWEKLCKYIMSIRKNKIFTRKEIIKISSNKKLIDEYRCILTNAGYLQTVENGKYKRIGTIKNLTYREARRQAYPYINDYAIAC